MRRHSPRRIHKIRKLETQARRRLLFEPLEDRLLLATINNNLDVGTELRNYRIAVATTVEYTTFFGSEAAALAAVQDTIASLNAIFEPELAIHLDLVDTGTDLIFSAAEGDSFTGSNLSTMLGQNQTLMNTVVQAANYDVGHVFHQANLGGLASLGVVGDDSFQARGASSSSTPAGTSWVGLVAHELAHQFGARHTFNSVSGFCNGNRSSTTAYEPGSGSTIMSYAGSCNADNLQSREDLYFHADSFEAIENRIRTVAVAAPNSTTALGNAIPTVSAGLDYHIPANTPFELTATGADADTGDTLTYTWEQLDLGGSHGLPLDGGVSGPLFRSFEGTTDATRTFPRLTDLLANVNTAAIGEVLPTISRDLNFRVTVRDQQGGVNSDDVLLTTHNTGAAFAVTAPNTAVSWLGGSTQTITWNVAGTTANGINTSDVEILLSTDGGLTFPHSLGVTPNDGSHTLAMPNINAASARIKVAAVGNVYFDVSDVNFTLTADGSAPGVSLVETAGSTAVYEGATTDSYTLALNTAPAGDVQVAISAGAEIQVSVDGVNFSGVQTLTLNSTTPQTVFVRAINDADIEGSQLETITHTIVSSTSASYPTSTLVNLVTVNVADDELPPLIGIDFDNSAGGSPQNWQRLSFLTNAATNLTRDDGVATTVDFDGVNITGGSLSNTTQGATNSGDLPIHNVSLSEIDGTSWFSGSMDFVFDGLSPNTSYGFFVFGLDNFIGNIVQNISVNGGPTLFTQTLTAGVLAINDATLNNTDRLVQYEQVATSTAGGVLTIRATAGNGNGVALAGIAIREIYTPVPAVTVIQTNNSTLVSETGTTDTFTVMLNAAPASDVVVDVSSSDTGEATVSASSLTFTPANWNTPQTITVTGVNDPVIDGDQNVSINLSINDAASDNQYDPLPDLTIDVVNADDDTAGTPGFTIVQSDGTTAVNESGSTDTFTVVLDSAPLTDVVIDVSSGDTGEATVSPVQLTFTSTNWNTPQTVTVTGVDDPSVDGDQSTTVTVSINDALSDNAFDPVADQT
ncbi:MAG: hypothetical protein KDB14_13300, partial [Planctomycetales bacterium]|nr:hypothetical protein [Planctomycetales bacterium]